MAPTTTSSKVAPFPPELERFVFSPDPFLRADFPRGLMPREVVAFVVARLRPGVPDAALEQLFLVVDHYDVHEVVPPVLALAEPKRNASGQAASAPVSPLARCTIIKLAALAGLAEDRARAAALYATACTEATADDLALCQALIETFEMANLALDAAPLAEKLGAAAGALAGYERSTEPADAENRRKYGELETLARRLQRAQKAVAPRRSLLAMPDRAARIARLVRIYLDLPADVPGYHIDWAARQLRRETWAPQPEAQIERTFDGALRAELVAAFRQVLNEIGEPGLDDAAAVRRRVAALDAVLFFNGRLSDDEGAYVVTHGKGYSLALSVRQLFPTP